MAMEIQDKNSKGFLDTSTSELMKKHIIPVAAAGVIDRVIFHPWETLITVKQDTGQSLKMIYRDYMSPNGAGIKGLYKGYIPNIIAAIPIRVSIFATYSVIKEQGQKTNISPTLISLGAGCFTGFLESTILCPVDAYRVRKTLKETAKEPFHLRYFFKGYGSLLARTSVENTICLLGTDVLMGRLSEDAQKHPAARYACALLAGAASQYVSIPADTIKTRCMKYPDKSYVDVCKSLYREGNLSTFFRAAGAKASRAGVCNAVMIGTSTLLRERLSDNRP